MLITEIFNLPSLQLPIIFWPIVNKSLITNSVQIMYNRELLMTEIANKNLINNSFKLFNNE